MTMRHETTTPIAIPIASPIVVTENSEQRSFIGLLKLLLDLQLGSGTVAHFKRAH